ncbi:hypothetical protein [Arenicella xantha]|uniref:Uncharacterized protein n=1 Tax=Arenicella xantha TaxID=644221 RepID=A0A395JGJ7_9GAMM|nr:hypothetical protein [Arenicella xantha]RBP48943.1 hypothetical protein DFR28_105283 [Arenicella xantha]
MNSDYLKIAGGLSFVVAFVHLLIPVGGPAWYRFFGAGEHMASMAEQGLLQPTVVTLAIAAVLALWGAYAWSAAGILPAFPVLKSALVLITSIYLLRGILGLVAPFISDHPQVTQNSVGFWVWSSIICLVFGLVHLKGVVDKWFV